MQVVCIQLVTPSCSLHELLFIRSVQSGHASVKALTVLSLLLAISAGSLERHYYHSSIKAYKIGCSAYTAFPKSKYQKYAVVVGVRHGL
jgi:hypothetical protein